MVEAWFYRYEILSAVGGVFLTSLFLSTVFQIELKLVKRIIIGSLILITLSTFFIGKLTYEKSDKNKVRIYSAGNFIGHIIYKDSFDILNHCSYDILKP